MQIPTNKDEKYRLQYLVPSLCKLKIRAHSTDHSQWNHDINDYDDFEYTSKTFLEAIQANCPNLTKFQIERPQNKSQADAVLSLLKGVLTIRKVTIVSNRHYSRCDMQPGESRDALYYLFGLLAGHVPLQYLNWKILLTPATVAIAEQAVLSPFRDLTKLKVHAKSFGIEAILPHVQNLETLDLHVDDDLRCHTPPPSSVLSSIGLCSNLRKLKFLCTDEYVLAPEELLVPARGCNRLENLVIGRPLNMCDALEVSDHIFEQAVSMLPFLRTLDLDIWGPLSTQSLIALSKYCPDLEYLALGGQFDLSILVKTETI